jgi:diguanylate cyclase (GGDEF)-like protein
MDQPREELPESWLVADVSSRLHRYGRIVAIQDDGEGFFPQELQLLQVYARYAATSLDVSTALADSQRGHTEARALLGLSRALAEAGTGDEVAGRLADAVPAVVDCDRVGVFLWDEKAGELTCRAVFGHPPDKEERMRQLRIRPVDTPALAHLVASPESEPLFFDPSSRDPFVSGLMRELGGRSMVVVPIVARTQFYGVLTVGVVSNMARLAPGRELLERLAGVVGHAASALENSRLIDRITDQACHDGLTGLANRVHFAERIETARVSAREAQRPLGLLYIDLDQFKAVNDEYGHSVGDELLVEVAARLSRVVRREDTVARLGGDEFAVILAASSEAEIQLASQRLGGVFDEPFALAGEALRVNASMGYAIWPSDEAEVEALLRHADAAMYRVKRRSRELAAAAAEPVRE